MRNRFACLLVSMWVLVLPAAVEGSPRRAAWTVALYCNADSEIESAVLGQLEALLPYCGSPSVNVVAYVDRHDERGCCAVPRGYSDRGVAGVAPWSGGKCLRGRLGRFEDLTPAADWHVDTGSPSVLGGFLSFVRRRFPAEREVLILDDHGGGPGGLCRDVESAPCEENYGTHLSLKGLASALHEAGANVRPYDVVMFDACDMATFEVMETLAPLARYAVAAESQIYADFPHDVVLHELTNCPRIDTACVARRFAEVYENPRATVCDDLRRFGRMSAFDLGSFGDVCSAVKTLSEALRADLSVTGTAGWKRFTEARLACEFLLGGGCLGTYDCEVVDLGELATNLTRCGSPSIAGAAEGVLRALPACVLCSSSAPSNRRTTGMSLYCACDTTDGWVDFPDFVAQAPWGLFLHDYAPCRSGPEILLRSLPPLLEALGPVRAGSAVRASATVVRGREWLGPTHFTVLDEEGAEIGPRVPVRPNEAGVLEATWPGTAYFAEGGDDSFGLPVDSLQRVSNGEFVAEARVMIDGRRGVLRFLVDSFTGVPRGPRLFFSDGRGDWRSKLIPLDEPRTLRPDPRVGGMPAQRLTPFFRGTGMGVVRTDRFTVRQEVLRRGSYKLGFIGSGLSGSPVQTFSEPVRVGEAASAR